MAKRAMGYGAIVPMTVSKGGKPTKMWRLEMAAHRKSGRKRLRRYFAYKPDAEAARDAELLLREDRTSWLASLSGTAIRAIEETIERLGRLPEPLRQAFDWGRLPALVDDHAWVHDPHPLERVFQDYIDEQKALKKRPETLSEGKPKATKKQTYLVTVAAMQSRLCEDPRFDSKRNAKTIAKTEIVDWANKLRERLHPDTVDTYIRIGKAIWNRAIQLDHLRMNPFAVAKSAPRGEDYVNLIDIHTPEEMERMLTVAWDYDPGMLGYVGLGYIFGLRGCEIIELDRSDIHREDGYIQVRKGKSSGNGVAYVRSVHPLSEAQWRWLDPLLESGLPICPPDYAKRLTRLRELAGLPEWERFIFRRTAMSYWFHNGVPEPQIKYRAGQRQRSGVAFEHYIADISPKIAPCYLRVLPPSRPPGIKKMPVGGRKRSRSLRPKASKLEVPALEPLNAAAEEPLECPV